MPFFFSFLKKNVWRTLVLFVDPPISLNWNYVGFTRDLKLRVDLLMHSIDSVDSPLSARPAELLAPSLATDPRGRWDLSSDPFVSPSSAFTHSTTRIWKNYNRWRFIFSTRFLFPDPLISISGSVDFYFRIRWFLFPDPLGRKHVKIIKFSIQKQALYSNRANSWNLWLVHERHNSLGM